MIWATVISQSYFCWLYRASASSATKNIINLNSVLAIWWCPSAELSLVFLEGGVITSAFFWQNSVSLCSTSCVLQGQMGLLLQVSLDFLILHSSPLWWKGHHFLMLFLKGLVGLHRTINFIFFSISAWSIDLGVLLYWMVCLGNEPRSFCFWDCTQVLHFRLFLTMRAMPFLLRDSCPQ